MPVLNSDTWSKWYIRYDVATRNIACCISQVVHVYRRPVVILASEVYIMCTYKTCRNRCRDWRLEPDLSFEGLVRQMSLISLSTVNFWLRRINSTQLNRKTRTQVSDTFMSVSVLIISSDRFPILVGSAVKSKRNCLHCSVSASNKITNTLLNDEHISLHSVRLTSQVILSRTTMNPRPYTYGPRGHRLGSSLYLPDIGLD